jgi:hypothetical protein
MIDDPRVDELLEELLVSGGSLEEACEEEGQALQPDTSPQTCADLTSKIRPR